MSSDLPRLAHFIFVVGPTACGKSQLALRLAEKLKWPIINCDSVQVYQGVNIGTAKPSAKDLQRTPHFLFDYVEPPHQQTAADYLKHVADCLEINQIHKAIFVGGSGFYLQALEKGLYPEAKTSAISKQDLQDWMAQQGMPALYHWVKQRDPIFAAKINVNDHYRVRRAVEVMKTCGLTMTQVKAEMSQGQHCWLPPHKSLKVGLSAERSVLRPRVEVRTAKMLEAGLVDEVRYLRDCGYSHWPPLQSVGYKEVQAFLDGEILESDLAEKIVTATVQLIKKQQTWFKRDSDISWFTPEQIDSAYRWVLKQELAQVL